MSEMTVEYGANSPYAGTGPSRLPPGSPFTNLNAIVLSIEWEITDDIMQKLMAELDALKEQMKKGGGLHTFLQLHSAVGHYIRIKKEAANPAAIRFLHSVHKGMMDVLSNPDIGAGEKNAILNSEIRKYRQLKAQVLPESDKPSIEAAVSEPTVAGPEPAVEGAVSEPAVGLEPAAADLPDAVVAALNEIKRMILEEIGKLRADVQSLKERT